MRDRRHRTDEISTCFGTRRGCMQRSCSEIGRNAEATAQPVVASAEDLAVLCVRRVPCAAATRAKNFAAAIGQSENPVMIAPDDPKTNHLLAALPEEEWARWLQQLEYVAMSLGDVLYEPGGTLSHVYSPTTAVVSLMYVMESGASAEIAMVGNEGIVGI